MEPGICYIKKEFLIEDTIESVGSGDKPLTVEESENTNKRKLDEGEENCHASKVGEKWSSSNKKQRKRGQNKNRPVYKENRTLHLCHSLVEGPSETKCPFPNCRFVHDITVYLESKGNDLGPSCPVFVTRGYCPRGITCRYAKSHLNGEGKNLRAPDYNAAKDAAANSLNRLASDLQVRLRKRKYDFSHCKKVLAEFEKQREDRKLNKKDTPAGENHMEIVENDKLSKDNENEEIVMNETIIPPINQPASTEKLIGTAFDMDPIKPAIDFREKVILSPLTTVGNLPFRRICKEFGADITCGEMACAVPLLKGMTQEWALTRRHPSEDIFGVQLCGSNPTVLAQTVELLQETCKVDFIDLNIGCPIDLIYQQGGGSALMRRTNILELTVRTCAALSTRVPFTVKMRTGVYADKSVAHELVPLVEEWGAAAVTIHGRSREQRYTRSANWAYIEECASKARHMPIIGNGDILNYEDFKERRALAPHVSSVMIGRGALIKPWIFQEIKDKKPWKPTSADRFAMMQKYVNYGLDHWGSDTKGVETTRRFLLEWQSFLYRYIPHDILEHPPQLINQRPQKFRGRDELETLMASGNASDWVKISEMLLGPVPNEFIFVPKHKANAY